MALTPLDNCSRIPQNKKESPNSTNTPASFPKPEKLPEGWPFHDSSKQQSALTRESNFYFDASLQVGPVVQASKTGRNHWLSSSLKHKQGNNAFALGSFDIEPDPQVHWDENLNGPICSTSSALSTLDHARTPKQSASSLANTATQANSNPRLFVQSKSDPTHLHTSQNDGPQPHHENWPDSSRPMQVSGPESKLDYDKDQTMTDIPDSTLRTDASNTESTSIPALFTRSPSHRLSEQHTLNRPLRIGDEVHLTDANGNDPTGQITYQITSIDTPTGGCTIVPVPRPQFVRPGRLVRAPIPHYGFASVFEERTHLEAGKKGTHFEEVDIGAVKERWVEKGKRRYMVESWTRQGIFYEGVGDEDVAAEWV